MRIGFYGGSFDPPHRGHLAVARAARDRYGLERVLLAPTGRQPLKRDGATAPFQDRLRMTALLCAGEPALEASAVDGPHPDGSMNYTVDTLRQLRRTLPAAAEIFAVVGADAFQTLPQWRGVQELLGMCEWLVVSRPDVPLRMPPGLELRPEQTRRVHLLEGVADPTSATDLRARLRAGLPCAEFLPASVLGYIREQRLYRA